jgi:hypothetical protein
MRLGFFTMPIHPPDKDWRVSLKEDREAFILADELGYVEGYIGEHTTDRAENITSCMMFIASMIEATKRIKLGTGTINLPNTHPAAVAANVAMLDHMLGASSSASAPAVCFPTRRCSATSTPIATKGSSRPSSGAGDLVEHRTVRYRGKVLAHQHRAHADAGHRPGLHRQAAAEAAPADRRPPRWRRSPRASERPRRAAGTRSRRIFCFRSGSRATGRNTSEGCRSGRRNADPANWRVAKSIFVADDDARARAYVMSPASPYRFCGQCSSLSAQR